MVLLNNEYNIMNKVKVNLENFDFTRYSISLLLSYKRPISMVVGDRRIGKTFFITYFYTKRALERGKLTYIFARLTKKEYDKCKEDFFQDIVKFNLFPEYTFKTVGDKGIATNIKTGVSFPICYFTYLRNAQSLKGVPFPDVEVIIVDEFMQEKGSIILKNAVNLLFSLMYTVFSLRKSKVILIGNAVSIENVFFKHYNITNINRGFTKSKDYVVENTNQEEKYNAFRRKAKASSFGKLVENTDYSKFALDNQFILDDYSSVRKVKVNTQQQLCIHFEDIVIGIYKHKEDLYFTNEKKITALSITPLTAVAKNGIIYIKPTEQIYKNYVKLALLGRIIYEDLSVKSAFHRLIEKNTPNI